MDPPERKRPYPGESSDDPNRKSHRRDDDPRGRREDGSRRDNGSSSRREEGSSRREEGSSRREEGSSRRDEGSSRRDDGSSRRDESSGRRDDGSSSSRHRREEGRSSSSRRDDDYARSDAGSYSTDLYDRRRSQNGNNGRSPGDRTERDRGRMPRAPEYQQQHRGPSSSNNSSPPLNGAGPSGNGSTVRNLQQLADPSRSTVNLNDEGQRAQHIEGRRVRRPRPTDAQQQDFVETRVRGTIKTVPPASSKNTTTVQLTANYFPLNSRAKFNLYHYHVDFDPSNLKTFQKRNLFNSIKGKFGFHIFDGSALYVCKKLSDNVAQDSYAALPNSNQKCTIKFKLVNEITPFDAVNIQVYNTIIRHCMRVLDLTQMGRHYYDHNQAVINGQHRLEMWPGYKTSLRQHERSLMLCVEMTNKVLRQDTVYDSMRRNQWNQERIEKELLGQIVMTDYNRKTYRIDQIAFDESPQTKTFEFRSRDNSDVRQISLVQYMQQQYQKNITNHQPILYSRAKKAQIRRGMSEKIALVPELCRLTGLADDHRKNFTLMRELNNTLQLNPNNRVRAINGFSARLQRAGVQESVLSEVGLHLSNQLVQLEARRYNPETILFGEGEWTMNGQQRYDWIAKQQTVPMRKTVILNEWAVISPLNRSDSFVRMIIAKARNMGCRVNNNYDKEDIRPNSTAKNYVDAIDQVMARNKQNIQMLVVFLPRQDEALYGAIKRRCYIEFGVPSQCVQTKHVDAKPGKESAQSGVAVKLAAQICCKLGGIPWELKNLPKSVMVVGFNISQSGRALGTSSRSKVGALVATTNDPMSQFFSIVVPFGRDETLSSLLHQKMSLILDGYRQKNSGQFPKRIIFYRDGVGEGQLQSVVDTEIIQMKDTLKSVCPTDKIPQFTFIVVNKRINTKFFVNERGQFGNPGPGTCVDDIVTLPERYDFFLVSQTGTGQGTVSPASYNVICNESGYWDQKDVPPLAPYFLQMLTYKLCHMYYNWTSTVAVPSVCQYAHKLAFLQNIMQKCGAAEGMEAKAGLFHNLYYL